MKNRLFVKLGKVSIAKQVFGEPILIENVEIEMSIDVETESYKAQLSAGQENVQGLASFLAPYLKTFLDKYVADVTK